MLKFLIEYERKVGINRTKVIIYARCRAEARAQLVKLDDFRRIAGITLVSH